MNYYNYQIVLQEVPDEISIAFAITGCPFRCHGCHSPELRNPRIGKPLNKITLKNILERYRGMATCVLFYGGEWEETKLEGLLTLSQNMGYKTCLYTGRVNISSRLKRHLNYLKTGPYIKSRGNLSNPKTNQKFLNLDTNQDITYRFQIRR